MLAGQDQESLRWPNRSRDTATCPNEERFVTEQSAKLFWPIFAADFSREWEQSLSIATSQNDPPPAAGRIDPVIAY
jgi:hypothetical protein